MYRESVVIIGILSTAIMLSGCGRMDEVVVNEGLLNGQWMSAPGEIEGMGRLVLVMKFDTDNGTADVRFQGESGRIRVQQKDTYQIDRNTVVLGPGIDVLPSPLVVTSQSVRQLVLRHGESTTELYRYEDVTK